MEQQLCKVAIREMDTKSASAHALLWVNSCLRKREAILYSYAVSASLSSTVTTFGGGKIDTSSFLLLDDQLCDLFSGAIHKDGVT